MLSWFITRRVFTVGVVLTRESLTLDHVTSYVTAGNGEFLARCLTGLGPTSTSPNANGALGGLYFNGNKVPNSGESASCPRRTNGIQVRPGATTAGVTNFHRCGTLSTAHEGVYTCTMMNSTMMRESVRFHIYLNGRSEFT